MTSADFNLHVHFMKMINTKYAFGPFVHMLYKVYVNLCDFTAGSYVTLGTRAAQFYIYMSLGWSMPNIFALI